MLLGANIYFFKKLACCISNEDCDLGPETHFIFGKSSYCMSNCRECIVGPHASRKEALTLNPGMETGIQNGLVHKGVMVYIKSKEIT